jgi:Ran GTPase-activating protein (RanGAP) involved in mRNA processing and transport
MSSYLYGDAFDNDDNRPNKREDKYIYNRRNDDDDDEEDEDEDKVLKKIIKDEGEEVLTKFDLNEFINIKELRLKNFRIKKKHQILENLNTILEKNKVLQTLNLDGCELFSSNLSKLKTSIIKSKTLLKLNLKNNHLSNEGALHLSEIIENNKSITNLNISNNNIGSNGWNTLKKSLSENKNIEILSIEKNYVIVDGSQNFTNIFFTNSTIRDLNLRECSITNEYGLKNLVHPLKANKTLKKLNLSFNTQLTNKDYLADVILNNKSITELNLSENLLFKQGKNEDTYKFVESLITNKTITNLDLSSTFQDKYYDDENNLMDYKPINMLLKENKTIYILNLSSNKINDKGLRMIGEGLKENKNLYELDLSSNLMSPKSIDEMKEIYQNDNYKIYNLKKVNMRKNLFMRKTESLEEVASKLVSLDFNHFLVLSFESIFHMKKIIFFNFKASVSVGFDFIFLYQ